MIDSIYVSPTLTLRFQTDILSTNVDAIATQLQSTLAAAPTHQALQVDLSACRMIDSVGLNFLFTLLHHSQQRGVPPTVVITTGPLQRILQVAQLGRLFPVEVR